MAWRWKACLAVDCCMISNGKTKSSLHEHQAKWWRDVLESNFSRISVFPGCIIWWRAFFCFRLASSWDSWLGRIIPTVLLALGYRPPFSSELVISACGHSLLHNPVLTLNCRTFKPINSRARCSLITGHFPKNFGNVQESLFVSGVEKTKGIARQDSAALNTEKIWGTITIWGSELNNKQTTNCKICIWKYKNVLIFLIKMISMI